MIKRLSSLDDFFLLEDPLRDYLLHTYIDPYDAEHFQGSAAQVQASLERFWQKIYEEPEAFEEERTWTVAGAVADQIRQALNQWNTVLAILYQSDWRTQQEALFADWIPQGVSRPPSSSGSIQVLIDPFFNSDTWQIDASEPELGPGSVLWFDDAPLLFWRPLSEKMPPVFSIPYWESGEVEFDLWRQEDIERLIPILRE